MNTMTNSNLRGNGLFYLYFNVTVHDWGRSKKNPSRNVEARTEYGGTLTESLHFWFLSFVSYIARSVYLPRNDTANSGTGLSYQWLINNTPQIFSQVILMEWIPHLRFPFPRWLQLASRWQTKLTSTQVLRFSIMLLSMFLSIYLKIFVINYILFCYSENHMNFLLY